MPGVQQRVDVRLLLLAEARRLPPLDGQAARPARSRAESRSLPRRGSTASVSTGDLRPAVRARTAPADRHRGGTARRPPALRAAPRAPLAEMACSPPAGRRARRAARPARGRGSGAASSRRASAAARRAPPAGRPRASGCAALRAARPHGDVPICSSSCGSSAASAGRSRDGPRPHVPLSASIRPCSTVLGVSSTCISRNLHVGRSQRVEDPGRVCRVQNRHGSTSTAAVHDARVPSALPERRRKQRFLVGRPALRLRPAPQRLPLAVQRRPPGAGPALAQRPDPAGRTADPHQRAQRRRPLRHDQRPAAGRSRLDPVMASLLDLGPLPATLAKVGVMVTATGGSGCCAGTTPHSPRTLVLVVAYGSW